MDMRAKAMAWAVLGIGLVLGARGAVAQDVDPALKPYAKAAGEVAGSLKCVGSDTMNNLVAHWAEGFKKFYPSVREGIEGKGSASAPPALAEGTCSFGPMSRDWKPAEIDAFKAKHGSGGATADIRTWGDLGLDGEWKDKPISLYGRNASSGTYGYFKEFALFKGDFKSTVKEQPGSSAVVQAIASDKFGIGYSGIGYKTADVLAIALAAKPDAAPVEPEAANAYSGDYPLSRFLYLSVNRKPGTQLDPLRREFLRYVLSASGQEDVKKDGYLPLPAAVVSQAAKDSGIE